MTEKDKHTGFEKGFRDSFGDFSQMPDPAVWSRIEAGLQRRKRIVLFARFAAAASLLLLFGITGWLVFRTSDPAMMQPAVVSHDTEITAPEPELQQDQQVPDRAEKPFTEISITKEAQLAQAAKPAKDQPAAPSLTEPEPLVADIIEREPKTISADEITEIHITDPSEIAIQTDPVITERELPTLEEIERMLAPEEFLPEKAETRKWQLALGYGTIQGQAVTDPSVSFDASNANFGQDPFSAKLSTETRQFESVETTNHSQPITLGFLINRNFSDSWGIETGLLFTRLKTTTTTNIINDEYTEYGSELFYVGIPASIRLNMIRRRRFGMYISQGAVLEKGVRTRYYSNHYAFDALKGSEDESYVAEGVQVSSLTALGFEYKLTDLISIYAQPGLQVFFLNQTQPYNIRSSSAIWPSFQTGLKFHL